MKSFVMSLAALLLTSVAFSQKAKGNSDTTLRSYLTYACAMHSEYVSDVLQKCPLCNNAMRLSLKEQMKAEVVRLYTCPLHPDVICTKTGKCPECKIDLIEMKRKKKIG
jgi:transcription initiation factor IIE alpha subunit